MIKKAVVLMCISAFISACASKNTVEEESGPKTKKESYRKVKSPRFTYNLIFDQEIGWGYDFYDDGKLIVHQSHIPAIQGNYGFQTKGKAEKTAEYLLKKLNDGIFPPMISVDELDSLDVLPELENQEPQPTQSK